jgi:hypothetical protein
MMLEAGDTLQQPALPLARGGGSFNEPTSGTGGLIMEPLPASRPL